MELYLGGDLLPALSEIFFVQIDDFPIAGAGLQVLLLVPMLILLALALLENVITLSLLATTILSQIKTKKAHESINKPNTKTTAV